MNLPVRFSATAQRHLDHIYEYYLVEVSEHVAKKLLADLVTKINTFGAVPETGTVIQKPGSSILYRFRVVKNYKVVFSSGNDYLRIEAVFDARRNPAVLDRLLKKIE